MPEFKKDRSKFQMKYSKGGFPFQSPLKDDNKVAEETEEDWPSHLSQEDIKQIKNTRELKKEVDIANEEAAKIANEEAAKNAGEKFGENISKKIQKKIKSKKLNTETDYLEKRKTYEYDPSKHKL